MLRRAIFAMTAFAGLVGSPAWADTLIYANPSGWRLADYTSGDVVTFYAGSTCTFGQIQLPASTTSNDDRNRYWSLILTQKGLGRSVGVYYETTSGLCRITSFYGD